MAGTSTGSIQVALLNTPKPGTREPLYSTTDVVNFYSTLGHDLLTVSLARDLKTLWGLLEPRISSEKMEQVFTEKLGDLRLKDALTLIILPVYDLNTSSVFIFKSNKASLKGYRFVDILLSSIAIPNIIQPHALKIKNELHYLTDATLVANNPVFLTMTQVAQLFPKRPQIIVSIGVGKDLPPKHPAEIANQGIAHMLPNWMGMLYGGSDHTTRYLMKKLVQAHALNLVKFYRIDPMVSLGKGTPIDASVKDISLLKHSAESYIRTHQRYFADIVAALKEAKK